MYISSSINIKKNLNAMHHRSRALEPKSMYCSLTKRRTSVLFEYPEYRNRNNKGPVGTVYCENIIECYHNMQRCRYSGISALYPDPLVPYEQYERLSSQNSMDEQES